jgi:oligopeptide/dipeptide ABC transporter ATP-binding protein
VFASSASELKDLRRNIQIVFQDPFASLDPRLPVGDAIIEGLIVHKIGSANDRYDKMMEVMKLVGLEEYHANRYPHEFSGGQRQRIGIARALVLDPDFLILDEPVSALDVSIQAQVLNILKDLQDKLGLTYMFVAHNLAVVEHISDRVAVMYLGRIAEIAPRDNIFAKPLHPYTQALLSAIPVPDPSRERKRTILTGDVPSPLNPPSGCRFHPRCPIARLAHCSVDEPELRELRPGQWVACHYAEDFL